jgi:hypothetical protein
MRLRETSEVVPPAPGGLSPEVITSAITRKIDLAGDWGISREI